MLVAKLHARCSSCTSETLAPTFCGLAATLQHGGHSARPAGRRRYPETNSILFSNSFIVQPLASWHNQLFWSTSGIPEAFHRCGLPTMTP
jgi:hypothetical protein